ncbi:MAG TPA: glycosyltransferase [Symbiobacteriaceae bacterium]|nr:glycosyltransferase [Symbiobacteriaceae bacterium]
MIVKNEQENLPRALESVKPIAHEIIVVDTGSTDATVEIARSYGARVFHHPWEDNFSTARNHSLAKALGDWILVLDADEAVVGGKEEMLFSALSSPEQDAYMITLVNRGASVGRIPVLRIFRNGRGYRFEGRIHEQAIDSICADRNRVGTVNLEIEHFGYCEQEDARKGRRERNVRLLTEEMRENPNRKDLLYYLGFEHFLMYEMEQGEQYFRRMMAALPDDMLSDFAGITLSELVHRQGRYAEAWALASTKANSAAAAADAHLRMALAAAQEGDFVVVRRCTAALRAIPETAPGITPRSAAQLTDLEAIALWEEGQHERALAAWRAGVQGDPMDVTLANQWVRHLEMAAGVRRATVEAVEEMPAATVAAAGVGVLLRAGELDRATTLAQSIGTVDIPSVYVLHGLARAGNWERARFIGTLLGVDGDIHLATAAIWLNEGAELGDALQAVPVPWRKTLESLLSGRQVAQEHQWMLRCLLTMWAEVGCWELFEIGTGYLAGTEVQRSAQAAALLYRTGLHHKAKALASRAASEPDAQMVLGLCAYESGDMRAAAKYLEACVDAGPAHVRVYYRGALALERLGKHAKAGRLLELGRKHRPLSALLKEGAAEKPTRLHLGCGRNILPDWINLDIVSLPGVDIVADLDACGEQPLPLNDNSVDEFQANHLLEHLRNPLPFMQELYRVAKPGAAAVFRVPYGSSDDAYEDPTHVRQYFLGSFQYFSQPIYWRADYGYRGDWEVAQITLYVDKERYQGKPLDEVHRDVYSLRNVVREMQVELRAIKPMREPKRELLRAPKISCVLV